LPALYRGADAAILVFDVNTPFTMESLGKWWWADFRERAPLADEEVEDFCCATVGNKADLVTDNVGRPRGGDSKSLSFVDPIIWCTSGTFRFRARSEFEV